MSFPRYPEYKDSGVEWLGEVPGHWAVTPLKYVVRFRSGGTPSKDRHAYWGGSIPWASSKDMKSEALSETIDHITELAIEEGAAALLPAGTVVVVVRGMILARAFPVALTGAQISINQDLKALEATGNVSAAFLAWYLRGTSDESLRRLDEAAHGTKALRMEAWASLPVSFPDIEEQVQISAFLDRETAKIDALVAEQQNLIALLKEKRQALISHAVTKGLDPDVPMKDPGVAWLGEVPAHWIVVRFRDVCGSISTGPFGTALAQDDYVTGGVPVINPSHISENGCCPDQEISVSVATAKRLSYWAMKSGDLVTARRGELGRAAVVSEEQDGWICGTGCLCVRPDSERVQANYLRTVLQSRYAREYLNQWSVGSTMANLNEGILGQLPMALPPSTLQQGELLASMDSKLAALRGVEVAAFETIALLQERRTALISAAVTGKIDVRYLAAAPAIPTPEPA